MADTANVMPQLHMPLQSGSDRILKAMRRSYRAERFLGILDRVRAAIPNAAISTDIIVGFPGETEADFDETLRVVAASQFAQAFTFQYSPRPGTPAATLDDQIPKQVVQHRYERLVELQDEISWANNRALVGTDVEVLIARNEGRKDGATQRLSGRAKDNRLVHVAVDPDIEPPRPGDMVTTTVTYAAPHYLVADPTLTSSDVSEEVRFTRLIRPTAAGDAWERRIRAEQAPDITTDVNASGSGGVLLGMPKVPSRPARPTSAGH
jgi:tRNA-2-methylthio-N6-dimethylallyladenosine synthase